MADYCDSCGAELVTDGLNGCCEREGKGLTSSRYRALLDCAEALQKLMAVQDCHEHPCEGCDPAREALAKLKDAP